MNLTKIGKDIVRQKTEILTDIGYMPSEATSEASSIFSESNLDWCLIGTGSVFALAGIGAAYLKYTRKDIVS